MQIKNIIVCVSTVLALKASGQTYGDDPKFGTTHNRSNSLFNLGIPRDTFSVPTSKQGYPHIAAKGTSLFVFDTAAKKWNLYSSGSAGWALTGNAVSTDTNFIGTTTNRSFSIRVNNILSGHISKNLYTTYFGMGNLNANPYTTEFNTAFGSYNLSSVTTGTYNVGVGVNNLYSNTEGYDNVAIGSGAMYNNTTGFENIGIGTNALAANISNGGNIAIGKEALLVATAPYNSIVGWQAARATTTGERNSAIGANALLFNTTGSYNSVNGAGGLENNTTGSYNSANGYNALLLNTTGSGNIGIGWNGMANNATGDFNVGVGYGAGKHVTKGTGNVFLGGYSGWVSGQNDTINGSFAIGYQSITTEDSTGVLGASFNKKITLNGRVVTPGLSTGIGDMQVRYNSGTGELEVTDTVSTVTTLQESITASNLMTGPNDIDLDGHDFSFVNTGNYLIASPTQNRLEIGSTGTRIVSANGSKAFQVNNAFVNLTGLSSSANGTDSMIVLNTTNGLIGWREISGKTTLATFGAGARLPGDTAAFTDSTIYGSFYNDEKDTLVITGLRIVMQGINDTLTINIEWNDSLNVTGTKLKTAYAAANNNYTGNSYTSFDNTKIPPGNHVWCKSPTVIPGRRPTYLSVTLIGYKKRV